MCIRDSYDGDSLANHMAPDADYLNSLNWITVRFTDSDLGLKILWDVRLDDPTDGDYPYEYLEDLNDFDINGKSSDESLIIQNPYLDGDEGDTRVLYRGAYNAPITSSNLSLIYNNPGSKDPTTPLTRYQLLHEITDTTFALGQETLTPEAQFCRIAPWITDSPRGELFDRILPDDVPVPELTIPYIDDNKLPERFEPRENGIGITCFGNKFTIDKTLNNDHTGDIMLSAADLNEATMNTLTEKIIKPPRLDINVSRFSQAFTPGFGSPRLTHQSFDDMLLSRPDLGFLKGRLQFCLTATDITTCLLYTSPSPRDRQKSRMPSSA